MFCNNCYITIWEKNGKLYEEVGKTIFVNGSTSVKTQNGTYETDFSHRVLFVGEAYKKIKVANLENRDKIKLLSTGATYKKGKDGRYYDNFICFDCEILNKDRPPKQPDDMGNVNGIGEVDDSQLPF